MGTQSQAVLQSTSGSLGHGKEPETLPAWSPLALHFAVLPCNEFVRTLSYPQAWGKGIHCPTPPTASSSPSLQLLLCLLCHSPLQQCPQELMAGVGGTQRSPHCRLHLCCNIPVPAGTRGHGEVSLGLVSVYWHQTGSGLPCFHHHQPRVCARKVPAQQLSLWCPIYLSASTRASIAKRLQLVGSRGISRGISLQYKQQQ